MDEKAKAEALEVQRTTDVPNPAAPVVSGEVTTAVDPPSNAGDTPAPPLPRSEPPATEAERPTPIHDKSLSFLQPGTQPGSLGRLGQFEVLEVLGKGGFGIVLKAFDEKLQRLVAIKVLGPQLAGNASARSRFVREARSAAAVNSKHVVSTYAVDEQPIPYLVMEYVAGMTLQDRIDQVGSLETRDILRVGAEIAEGLAAAHKQGLIHRDIKPANILLQENLTPRRQDAKQDKEEEKAPPDQAAAVSGPSFASLRLGVRSSFVAKIADFGLARAVDDASLTQSGVIAGTPRFMSPEQARGETLDHRSDLFSLGSVLYTLCTGQPPFRSSKTLGILKRVCDDTPRPIREINPAIPDALAAIVNLLLVKDPAGRFQTAAAVADLLRQHLAHLDDPSLAPPPVVLAGSEAADHLRTVPAGLNADPAPKKQERPRRTLALWVAAACIVLVAAGSLLLFLLPPGPTDQGAPKGNPNTALGQSPVPETRSAAPASSQIAQAAAGASARGDDFARRGQWALAAKESRAEVAANPGDRILWTTAAARLIMAGDLDGYRQLCSRMVKQFRSTTAVEQADSVCKVCLLLPNSADRSLLPSRALADGVEQGAQPYYHGWFYACLALIAYRDGQYEKVTEYSEKSLAVNHKSNPDGALALLVQAMAQHQLQQADQSRTSLTEGTALVPYDLATLGSPDFQGTLPVSAAVVTADWLIAEILRREAALLILQDARRPLNAAALRSRGLALFNQGKLDDALAALRQALDQEERHGWNHYLVGVILVRQAKTDEAIREFRRAMEISPDYAPPYVSLGVVLANLGKGDEAIPLLQKALELEPQFAPAHSLLGELFLHQGKVDEAAATLSKAIELAPQDRYATQLHAEVLRLQALLPRLDQFTDGTEKPIDNAQRLDLARLCHYRQRFAASTSFYAAALAADPQLRDDPTQAHRYNAACAAARAGHGEGDAEKLGDAERSRWRKQAIAWLRAELDAVTTLLAASPTAERPRLLARLQQWKVDSDLASLRDADEVGKLPDDQRALLKSLWSDLDAALQHSP
jgi:serine/threonine protein kinase/tetratricopeptide (TPR) repeat protein